MSWEIVPSIITAIATAFLAYLTCKYMNELKKQNEARERREMRTQVLLPLLKNLKNVSEVPREIDDTYKGLAFALQSLEKEYPHLFVNLPEDLLEQLENFGRDYDRLRNSFESIWEKINTLLKEELYTRFEIQAKHMKSVFLFAGNHSRDIYSFIYEGTNPKCWFAQRREEYCTSIEPVIKPVSGAAPPFKNENPVDFNIFADLSGYVQERIGEDEELKECIRFRKKLLEVDAKLIIEKIEALVRNRK